MYTFNLLKFFIILYFLNFMKTIAVLKIKIYQNENKKKKNYQNVRMVKEKEMEDSPPPIFQQNLSREPLWLVHEKHG